MGEKIKNIYKCERLEGDDPLVVWYNQVIEKREEDLTIADVARCFRQQLFIDTALDTLLVYLLNNPYASDLYAGEFMEKANDIDGEYIRKHKNIIAEILKKSMVFINNHTWEYNEEKDEFLMNVCSLAQKLN